MITEKQQPDLSEPNSIKFTETKSLLYLEHARTADGVRYRFSDRPDEIFQNVDELKAHRGLSGESLRNTVRTIKQESWTKTPTHQSRSKRGT